MGDERWLLELDGQKFSADTPKALNTIRQAYTLDRGQLVVEQERTSEYLNLFLGGDRALLFRVDGGVVLKAVFAQRLPLPDGEVAFLGREPDKPWFVPRRDTIRRVDGLALLEEFVHSGTVPNRLPVWAIPHRQLVLTGFEGLVEPDDEFRSVEWQRY